MKQLQNTAWNQLSRMFLTNVFWFFQITGCWYIWNYIVENRQNSCFFLFLVAEISSFYTADIFNCVFFATYCVCMRLLHRKSVKFRLSLWLTIISVRFLFKLVVHIRNYFAKNWQKSHVFRDWSPKNAFLFN